MGGCAWGKGEVFQGFVCVYVDWFVAAGCAGVF